MKSDRSLLKMRDWLFSRCAGILNSGEWSLEIKDFSKSNAPDTWGLTDFEKNIIYLDRRKGTPRILIHEMGHVIFSDILDAEMRVKSEAERGRALKWDERRMLEFENFFYNSLTDKQIAILQFFISDAKTAS